MTDGPTHAYIGASPGCWARYGELLARGVGGQMAVDTYAVQHPGVDERRSRQSVAVHLLSLCAVLERGARSEDAVDLLRRALAGERDWTWLDHDPPLGTLTVDDVLTGRAAVDRWAGDAWSAWSAHHATVRGWLDAVSGRRD
jgi:hypothetical protein